LAGAPWRVRVQFPCPLLRVVCEACRRRERYEVEALIRQYGADAKLPDLLPLVRKLTALLADCPKRGSVSVYDRCKAVFERRT
jgi:hypothetical protein